VIRKRIRKILIANRGEIALRVIRACREMGIETVALYSEVDRNALHVRHADKAFYIGPAPSAESYLAMEKIIKAARRSKADAIHPGYGFLAENPEFVKLCEDKGINFIGPRSEVMALVGSKTASRRTMAAAGVPVIPGLREDLGDSREAVAKARELGFPVILKASAGGGGKGMRVVRGEEELPSVFKEASEEAQSAFGDPSLYLEKYLEKPRHIEFQFLADHYGHVVHLGERECSIQRRHQKLVEESPSPVMTGELRQKMGETAVRAVKATCYNNAGTIEFLVDKEMDFYFLEVNARLQVEHPVTEMVTGLDLVKEQIRIAAGEKLAFSQEDIHWRGSALECRISAEDPFDHFLPSVGVITRITEPGGPGVRLDSSLYSGLEITPFYDPLVAKLIVWGKDRDESIERMARALKEFCIEGIKTNIPFHQKVMENPSFVSGNFNTSFIEDEFQGGLSIEKSCHKIAAIVAAIEEYGRGLAGPTVRAEKQQARADVWKTAAIRQHLRQN
jgi:acetyl-CoA carboxylase biotin carboxylase subunit